MERLKASCTRTLCQLIYCDLDSVTAQKVIAPATNGIWWPDWTLPSLQSQFDPPEAHKESPPTRQRRNGGVPRYWLSADFTGRQKISFFQNASNLSFNQPIMGDSIHIIRNDRNPNVLREMLEYVISGAEYDSSARDTPPRCHPGTRTKILVDVRTHIHDRNVAAKVAWIHGAAGVGKSAIMQSLAEAESSLGTIFTTLFFSRLNERDDPKKAFATLAYGLAVANPEYQQYLAQRFVDDPAFLAKSMEEQFQRLFVTPFVENHVNFGSQRWIVFLDGLDECRGETDQCRILDLIHNSLIHHGGYTPFVWVIASRPEPHLKTRFGKIKADIGGFLEVEVPVNSNNSSQDVERYLHAQFLNIRENYSDAVPPLWPSATDFLRLAQVSSGLFIFVSTLIAYLLDGDPVSRLKHIVFLIEGSRSQFGDLQQNPFQTLDLLYIQIMSDIPKEVLITVKHLLGFYLVEAAMMFDSTRAPLLEVCNTLGFTQHTAYVALRKLSSVLAWPPPPEAERSRVRFLHSSFSDFLLDASRSQAYHINLSEELTYLWHRDTKVLRQFAVHRTYTRIEFSWIPVTDISRILRLTLLASARKRWMKILLHNWRASPDAPHDIRLMVDDSSLIDIFRDLGPTLFFRIEGYELPIEDFFNWLHNDAPLELRQCFLVKPLTLSELDIDRLFKSLCEQRWCYSVYSEGFAGYFRSLDLMSMARFNASQWLEAKKAIWKKPNWSRYPHKEKAGLVRVVGFEPSKYCAVIGPCAASLKRVAYYVLPYSEYPETGLSAMSLAPIFKSQPTGTVGVLERLRGDNT